jgi:hypothetical protein
VEEGDMITRMRVMDGIENFVIDPTAANLAKKGK